MPTAHQQGNERRCNGRILERRREEVTLEMMHPDQRQVTAPGEGLPVHHANEQGAHEARRHRDRDPVEVTQRHPRLGERPIHHRRDCLHVRPARQLRHDAPEDGVHILRQDDQALERGDTTVSVYDGCRGFIARGFDAEDVH